MGIGKVLVCVKHRGHEHFGTGANGLYVEGVTR